MADDPIKHVVLLALENRSFDHMLGDCGKPGIDGIPDPPRSNHYESGVAGDPVDYTQAAGASRVVADDPRHETNHVLTQLKAIAGIDNGGFVQDYAAYYPDLDADGRAEVMRYHARGALPALHALAASYLVCDRWFSSVPGPTWANRLFMMSGTSLGRVKMPNGVFDLNLHWYDQTTLFDRLNEQGKAWKVYYGDTPLSLLLVHQLEPENLGRYCAMNRFFTDIQDETGFPDFVFIEPAYLDPSANDDHPSHDVLAGEALIASVYNALRSSPVWKNTLLVVLFDEHGGFYDHVAPPPAVPPDHHQEEYSFTQLGVRVPAILVSPYVGNGVLHDVFDHTSLLKYLVDKWGLAPLGERTTQANSFAKSVLAAPRADADLPSSIPATPAGMARVEIPLHPPLNDHQSALVQLSHGLETMGEEPAEVVAARSRQTVIGPQSQIDAAVDRFEAFLKRGTPPPSQKS
jgi:phospholipase C